jgi:hypothetical protein
MSAFETVMAINFSGALVSKIWAVAVAVEVAAGVEVCGIETTLVLANSACCCCKRTACFSVWTTQRTSSTAQIETTMIPVLSMINQIPNFFSGTGSWPQSPHGWQRQIRFAASQLPASAPRERMASAAYCEHVGVKRQPLAGPNKKICAGEIVQR